VTLWAPELESLRAKVRSFVDEHVVPAERAILDEDVRRERTTLKKLQAKAKAEGPFTPHLPPAFGGRGLGVMGMCALFR
jgi:acyl-CoA dehydrogenase